jgi:hypothetical protein
MSASSQDLCLPNPVRAEERAWHVSQFCVHSDDNKVSGHSVPGIISQMQNKKKGGKRKERRKKGRKEGRRGRKEGKQEGENVIV